jgi:hypothetical protein
MSALCSILLPTSSTPFHWHFLSTFVACVHLSPLSFPSQVTFKEDARAKLVAGINKVANAVKVSD